VVSTVASALLPGTSGARYEEDVSALPTANDTIPVYYIPDPSLSREMYYIKGADGVYMFAIYRTLGHSGFHPGEPFWIFMDPIIKDIRNTLKYYGKLNLTTGELYQCAYEWPENLITSGCTYRTTVPDNTLSQIITILQSS